MSPQKCSIPIHRACQPARPGRVTGGSRSRRTLHATASISLQMSLAKCLKVHWNFALTESQFEMSRADETRGVRVGRSGAPAINKIIANSTTMNAELHRAHDDSSADGGAPLFTAPSSDGDPKCDLHLLFMIRFLRLFAFGCCTVVLLLLLEAAGLEDSQIGTLLSGTMVGDLFITLLSMGCTGFTSALETRVGCMHYMREKLTELAAANGERMLETPHNTISMVRACDAQRDKNGLIILTMLGVGGCCCGAVAVVVCCRV